MRAGLGLPLAAALLLACDPPDPDADAADAVRIRIVSHPGAYAFAPARVRISEGETVRFVLEGPRPESVAFDTTRTDSAATAYVRERQLHHGPLLTQPGQSFEISFAGAPPGTYPFHSVSQPDARVRGEVVVE